VCCALERGYINRVVCVWKRVDSGEDMCGTGLVQSCMSRCVGRIDLWVSSIVQFGCSPPHRIVSALPKSATRASADCPRLLSLGIVWEGRVRRRVACGPPPPPLSWYIIDPRRVPVVSLAPPIYIILRVAINAGAAP
jgi:hypothetical protein